MAEVTYHCSGGPRVRGYLLLFWRTQSQYPAPTWQFTDTLFWSPRAPGTTQCTHTQIQVKHPYIKYIFKRRSNLNFRPPLNGTQGWERG